MDPKIIYEDEDIIIVDKPAGLPTHAANRNDPEGKQASNGAGKKETLVSFLIAHYPAIQNVGDVGFPKPHIRPGIVHRLDKETSGLMVVAKNNETFYELKRQFQERKVEKKYIALVSGCLEKDEGIIDTPLLKVGSRTVISNFEIRNSKQIQNSKFKIQNPKVAITEYKVIKRFKEYTLVEVAPKTGRMHQIRVHFASINHPISCDKLYGRKSKKCPAGLNRHFLHASGLKFMLKNALMEFDSKLPEDLEGIILNLSAQGGSAFGGKS